MALYLCFIELCSFVLLQYKLFLPKAGLTRKCTNHKYCRKPYFVTYTNVQMFGFSKIFERRRKEKNCIHPESWKKCITFPQKTLSSIFLALRLLFWCLFNFIVSSFSFPRSVSHDRPAPSTVHASMLRCFVVVLFSIIKDCFFNYSSSACTWQNNQPKWS